MSDTPETDAVDCPSPLAGEQQFLVMRNHARSLERRLQEAQRERYELRDKVKSLEFSRESTIGYLTRNVLEPHGVTPLSTAGGICTQIDNIVAGLTRQRDTAVREVEELKRLLRAAQGAVRVERESRIATGQRTDFHDGFLARIDAALAEKGKP